MSSQCKCLFCLCVCLAPKTKNVLGQSCQAKKGGDFVLVWFSFIFAVSSPDGSFWLIAMNWCHQSASRLPAEQTINWRHHLKFSHHRFGFLPQRVVSDKISEENDCSGLMLPISLPAGRTIRLFSRLRLFRRGFAGIWIISTQWFCGKSWRDMT